MDSLLIGLPFVILALSIYSFYRGYKQWKSGSIWWGKDEHGAAKQFTSDERVGFFTVGATWFGIILLVAAIGSFIWMQLEK
jgi:hypothetical protein